jgi:quercetin dioxygenase-like cupin family protein
MAFTVRRVETGLDGGRSVIRSDGTPPRTVEMAEGPAVSEILWLDGPATTADDGRDRDDAGYALEPPLGGASVRIIRLPAPDPTRPVDQQWLRIEGDDPAHPGHHTTDTLDLIVILDGRIVLGLEDGDHELAAGDTAIQRGTRHRWRVVGDRPCTYVVVMIRPDPAEPEPGEKLSPRAAAEPIGAGVRRLVAGVDAEGRSHAEVDGEPGFVFRPAGPDGVTLTELWQTGGPLRRPDQGGDPDAPYALEPKGRGIAFRMVDLPAGHDPGPAGWHTTNTIDVDIIVSGRMELGLSDADPTELGPGDVVVQRATDHRWRPLGDQPVRMAAVMFSLPGAPGPRG